MEGGREYQNLTANAAITDVSWRSDSNLVASVSEDGSLRLWEMENGKQIRSLGRQRRRVVVVEFSPNGNIVTARS